MTADDALVRVRSIFAENGWALSQYVSVTPSSARSGGWFSPRKKTWIVRTDTDRLGGNRVFEFDAATGELLSSYVLPR